MVIHKCNKEKEIIELIQRVRVIEKRLFGNGVKGIIKKLDDAAIFIGEHKGDLTRLRSALDYIVEQKQKSKLERMTRKEFISIALAIGIPILSGIIAFTIWLIKNTIQSQLKIGLGG